ncbi:hypothetical protein [Nonomuraea sp. NPDC001831]|uniref:hypothetical protein n=1 Tax=Nonomuraea sp. NPDC001831 TaxID=3364340 RepID=UPI0036B97AB2
MSLRNLRLKLSRFFARAKNWRLVAAICLMGLLCVWGSWSIQDQSWPSGVLVEIGATFLLFGPLLLIQKRTERRLNEVQDVQTVIQQRQEETATEISALSDELALTKDELQATREELSARVMERLNEARREDELAFEAVDKAPSVASVAGALNRAQTLGLVAQRGPRVEIFDTSTYLRFDFIEDDEGGWVVELFIEDQDGAPIDAIGWHKEERAEDILVTLGEKLLANRLYPGDRDFDSAQIFADLSSLLKIAHSKSSGYNPLGRVIQICPPQWAVTETGIKTIKDSSYGIPASRLHEDDWLDHMRGKVWVDYDSFSQALQDAIALFDAGRLAVKPQGWKEEVPF